MQVLPTRWTRQVLVDRSEYTLLLLGTPLGSLLRDSVLLPSFVQDVEPALAVEHHQCEDQPHNKSEEPHTQQQQ